MQTRFIQATETGWTILYATGIQGPTFKTLSVARFIAEGKNIQIVVIDRKGNRLN